MEKLMSELEVFRMITFVTDRVRKTGVEVALDISGPGEKRIEIRGYKGEDASLYASTGAVAKDIPRPTVSDGCGLNDPDLAAVAAKQAKPMRIYMLGDEVFVKGTVVEITQSIDHEDRPHYGVKIDGVHDGHWVVGVDRSWLKSDL